MQQSNSRGNGGGRWSESPWKATEGGRPMICCHVAFHARDLGSFDSHSLVPRERPVAACSIWLLDLKYNPEGY